MTEQEDAIAKARRQSLRENYPLLASWFTTAADKQDMEAAVQRQQAAARQQEEIVREVKQKEMREQALALDAMTHPRYEEMEEALSGLSKDLIDMLTHYEGRYWRYLIFAEKAPGFTSIWADNPLNKSHEDYLLCLKREGPSSNGYMARGYKDFGKDYKRRPFIFTTFQKYDGFSIGYDIEKGVYTYYVLEPTAYCEASGGGDTGLCGHGGYSYNPRRAGEEPKDWFIREKAEFKTPAEVLAHFEKYLQKTIGIAQAELPKNIVKMVQTAPGHLTLACLVVFIGLFVRSRPEEDAKIQGPEP